MRLYVNVIYIHGLDSDANSTKGRLLEDYCRQYHSDINILQPDLNKTPDQVFNQILLLIENLNSNGNHAEDGSLNRQTQYWSVAH